MADSSFDVVSSVDLQEVKNAIAQATKELLTRFDLKNSGSSVELQGEELVLVSSDEFKLKAVREILEERLVKRSVPLKALSLRHGRRRRSAARSGSGSRCRRASPPRRRARSSS